MVGVLKTFKGRGRWPLPYEYLFTTNCLYRAIFCGFSAGFFCILGNHINNNNCYIIRYFKNFGASALTEPTSSAKICINGCFQTIHLLYFIVFIFSCRQINKTKYILLLITGYYVGYFCPFC